MKYTKQPKRYLCLSDFEWKALVKSINEYRKQVVQTNVFGKKWQSCYLTELRIMLFKCGKTQQSYKKFSKDSQIIYRKYVTPLDCFEKICYNNISISFKIAIGSSD